MGKTKKNYFYQLIYQTLISVLPFITSPYLSRVIGAEGIGIYSYTFSVVTYFKIFAALGINDYGNRAIAQVRNDKKALNKTFCSLFAMHSALSICVIVAYGVYWCVFVTENRYITLIQGLYLFNVLFDVNWLFFGLEQFKLTVTRNSALKILTVVAIFVFVKDENDLWKYVLILAGGTLLATSAVWIFVPRYVRLVKFTLKEMFAHLKPMSTLFFAVIAVTIYSYMDKIMLGRLSSLTELGYYENAWKMIEFPVGFITALGTVMLPKISNLIANGDLKKANYYISESMQFSMLSAFAVAFGVAGIAKDFSIIFWGQSFSPCGLLMEVMSITIVFMSWNSVIRSQYLIPKEYDKVYLVAVSMGACVNFIINYLLIPKYAAMGAAVGTVAAYGTICAVQTIFVSKDLRIFDYFVKSLPYVIVGVVMFACVNIVSVVMGCHVFTIFLEVVIGVVVYLGGLIAFAIAFKNEFLLDKLKRLCSFVKNKN